MAGAKSDRKILFVQFTDPNAYPPLEHASRLLAGAGWRVVFLGTRVFDAGGPKFPDHPSVRLRLQRNAPRGWRQKVGYLWFIARCLGWSLVWRPKVLYCSEPLSTPAGWLLSHLSGARIIYHEHDTGFSSTGAFTALVYTARRKLARRALLCVVPQAERLAAFREELHPAKSLCVWNCPRRGEVLPERPPAGPSLVLFYVGTVSPHLLPETVITALAGLPESVKLEIVGYETIGGRGHGERLRSLADRLGIANRVVFHGPLDRPAFYRLAGDCDVGLCLAPTDSTEPNLRHLFGASNKVFDYLACGLPVLVSEGEPWVTEIVRPGYGVACAPGDPDSIRKAIRGLLDRGDRQRMGNLGRERILKDWNYETQFEPVLRLLED